MTRTRTLIGLAGVAALALAAPALAHARLVGSNPAANATVKAPPAAITLQFSERLVPTFSKFDLSMPAHHMVVPVRTAVSADGQTIVGTPTAALAAGEYTVTWTAASVDGHRMNGHFNFKVG
jgi:methionine-rich copper-binding protein CopC